MIKIFSYKGESRAEKKQRKQERLMERNQKLYEFGLRINQTLDLNHRFRLHTRLRFFRRFCAKHPKKTFVLCYAMMVPLIALTIFFEMGRAEEVDVKDGYESVLTAPNLVSNMRVVHNRNELVREQSRQLFDKATILKHEVDSIMAICDKSHEDSVLLASKLRQLDALISK